MGVPVAAPVPGRTASRHAPAPPSGRQARTDLLLARLHDPERSPEGHERAALLDQLVTVNTPLAHRIARRFEGRGLSRDDLQQTACLALVRAVQRFDPTAGAHFLAYVVPCITGEVKRHFRDQGWMIRPPRPVQELQAHVERELLAVDPVSGLPPTEQQVAARLGVSEEEVHAALMARGCFAPLSLELTLGDDGFRLGDTLVSSVSEGSYAAAEARAVLVPLLAGLAPDERLLLQLRFVDECSQRDIAAALGVSQPQVSRLLRALLVRLRGAVDGASAGTAPATRPIG